MTGTQLSTPVALLIFNRPKTTEKVFRQIAQARPKKLLVVADGARKDRDGEAEKCAEARAIVERIDWDCELLTNYSDVNLGTKRRVSSGLDWVFEEVEEAIILEDDCLPHPTFFPFCEAQLARYRHDERISMISGTNLQFSRKRTPYSYYFSRYHHIWGWASWRRAWQHYDVRMSLWPEVRDEKWLDDLLGDPKLARGWRQIFEDMYQERIDTWDYQWVFACWMQNRLAIVPNQNLISNIGFGNDATHTRNRHSIEANLATAPMAFPLDHPPYVWPHAEADRFEATYQSTLPMRLHGLLAKSLRALDLIRERYGGTLVRS